MIRTGNLGLSPLEAEEVTKNSDPPALSVSSGNCNPEGWTYVPAKVNHPVLLLPAAVHVSVGMTNTNSKLDLTGNGKDG